MTGVQTCALPIFVASETLNISANLEFSIVINTTGHSDLHVSGETRSFYDRTSQVIRVKSDFQIVQYRLLNIAGQLIASGQSNDHTLQIPIHHDQANLFLIETTAFSGDRASQKVYVW